MLKVGLTGNIGSGKSIIAEAFSIIGIPVYHADLESKKFLAFPSLKQKIITLFSDNILDKSGNIDRQLLANIVFNDEQSLKKLNSVLHPLVINEFMQWCETLSGHPYVIQEAAIIFESGVANLFDRIIHVSCPKDIAIERVIKRDGIDRSDVLQRVKFQLEDGDKASRSDFVINNDGTEMVFPQILSIHKQLSVIDVQH